MYICICNAVTDRQIHAAVAAGATSVDDVTMQLGLGAGCGCCKEAAHMLIHRSVCGGDCNACDRHGRSSR